MGLASVIFSCLTIFAISGANYHARQKLAVVINNLTRSLPSFFFMRDTNCREKNPAKPFAAERFFIGR